MNINQMMTLAVMIAGAAVLVLSLLLGAGNKKATTVWFVAFLIFIGMSALFGVNGLTLLLGVVVLIAAFWLANRILRKSPKN